jgi:hypothetical protein
LNGCAAVTIPTLRSDCNFSTILSIKRGSIRGSSPWTLITCANCFVFLATSAARLVPVRCLGEVRATSAPHSNAAEAIRISSVAITTKSKLLARRQRSQTCFRSGFPSIRCNGLPGNRVESHRAGIIPTALLMRAYNDPPACKGRHPEPRRRRGTSRSLMNHTRNCSRAMSERAGSLALLGMTKLS